MRTSTNWLRFSLLNISLREECLWSDRIILECKPDTVVLAAKNVTSTYPRQYLTSQAFRREAYWLGLYLLLGIALTIDNKLTMQHFPFPCAVTGFHAFFNVMSLSTLWFTGTYRPKSLYSSEIILLFLYAFMYSLNILTSNASLEFASLALHQSFKSLNPLLVVSISVLYFGKRFDSKVYASLVVICLGVLLTTISNSHFGIKGLLFSLLAVSVTGWKTVCTSAMLDRSHSRLTPLDLVFYISPLSCIHMSVISLFTNEARNIRSMWSATTGPTAHLLYVRLAVNAVIAIGLNIATFTISKYTGPVALSVMENVKQLCTVIIAVVFLGSELNVLNGIGLVLGLCGGVCYAHTVYPDRQSTLKPLSAPGSPV